MSHPPVLKYKVGELPKMEFQLVNSTDGKPIGDITGATVKVFIRLKGASSNTFSNQDGTIQDAANAIVAYQPPAAFAVAGQYTGEVKVTTGSIVRYSETFDIVVLSSLG